MTSRPLERMEVDAALIENKEELAVLERGLRAQGYKVLGYRGIAGGRYELVLIPMDDAPGEEKRP